MHDVQNSKNRAVIAIPRRREKQSPFFRYRYYYKDCFVVTLLAMTKEVISRGYPILSLIFIAMLSCSTPSDTGDDSFYPPAFNPTLSSSTQEIHDFLLAGNGSAQAKLVFVKKIIKNNSSLHTLCYIDFSEDNDTPVVHTIPAAEGAQVPVISPDGNWVVFAKGNGMTEAGAPPADKSSAYLCRLEDNATPVLLAADSAFEPRFVQNADTLTVIFPTNARDFAWCGFGRTMKIGIDVSGATPVPGTPQTLFTTAAFTGGLSWDNRYLCGGGGNVGMVDITIGSSAGDTACDFPQACNVSISASRIFTNTVMYLTAAGSHPEINGGRQWETWQVILVGNTDRDVVKGFFYPDSASLKFPVETDPPSFTNARWHHCEWSNHPYFAAATLNINRYFTGHNTTEYQERIYCINLKDSTYLEIVRPDTITNSGIEGDYSGFHWPWLWVETDSGFVEDAAWLSP